MLHCLNRPCVSRARWQWRCPRIAGGNSLPYFHDSNVLIGYYFYIADTWGKAATIVIDDPEKNYTSSFVWAECFGIENGGRCNTIKKRIVKEFRWAIAALKRNHSCNNLDDESEDWRIRGIIKGAIDEAGEDPDATGRVLLGIKDDFERECADRVSRLEDQEFLCIHRRRTDYPDLYNGLTGHVNDPDDIEVVLDGHDLSVSVPELVFWTGDGAHIVHNRDVILNLTNLFDVRYLGDENRV